MIKKINLLLCFWVVSIVLNAQVSPPKLNPLHGNAQIMEYRKKLSKQSNAQLSNRTQSTSTVSLTLPFYDEFSYAGPYPDSTRWVHSQSVFVNHTKATAPPTLGVATFDGLDKYGYPYADVVTSTTNSYISSDTLTSMPIRLDSLPTSHVGYSPSDSIFLSFYFEGRGYYDKPEENDYLSLDFYNSTDSTWNQIWTHGGYQFDPDSTWHLVVIPMLDTAYFHKDFQFRFRNISSGAGDVDHWHLDVVSLKSSPTRNDTIFPDHSFVYDLSSTLKNYSQMPYRQYTGAADMKTNISAFIRNNDNSPLNLNITTQYSSFDNTNGSYFYPLTRFSSTNLPYYYASGGGYCNATNVSNVPINFTYPILTDSNSYTMKFSLYHETIGQPGNDTISFRQTFNNYYAYDDGSAEAGFGLGSANGSGGYRTASRFTLNNADTLRAVDIFFDPVSDVAATKTAPFNILIYGDNPTSPGTPGIVLSTDSNRYVFYPADTIVPGVTPRENRFLRYQLHNQLLLGAGTTFYVVLSATFPIPQINVGFDMNTDFHNNMFYSADGTTWYPFPGALDPDYRGSLMIRPVFGDSLETLSIKEYNANNAPDIKIYPNPAQDYISIQSESTISKITISDLLGNTILQQSANSIKSINTVSLQSGVYFIKAFTDKGFANTQKLIITR